VVGHHHLPGLRDPDPGHPDRALAERGVGLTGCLLSVKSVFTVYGRSVLYLLGTKTRQQTAAEPVSPDYIAATEADPAP
jgi:hypothetical protein